MNDHTKPQVILRGRALGYTTIAPVRLAVTPEAHVVYHHGEMVAACPTLTTAMRVRELIDTHGLVAVPDDLEGVEA